MGVLLNSLINEIERLPSHRVYGLVSSVLGMLIEVSGVEDLISIGDHCSVEARTGRRVVCEVVGFRERYARVLPFGTLEGIGLGCRVEIGSCNPIIYPDASWLGRVVDAFGVPVDGKGPLLSGRQPYALINSPPPAHSRKRIGEKVDLGVRTMNAFLTVCKGQRLGIFSGSGVGKSTLLSMMARHTGADVSVIGLIGERGREVSEPQTHLPHERFQALVQTCCRCHTQKYLPRQVHSQSPDRYPQLTRGDCDSRRPLNDHLVYPYALLLGPCVNEAVRSREPLASRRGEAHE